MTQSCQFFWRVLWQVLTFNSRSVVSFSIQVLKGKGQIDNVTYLCKSVKESICLSLKFIVFKLAGPRPLVSAVRYTEGGDLNKRFLTSQESEWKLFTTGRLEENIMTQFSSHLTFHYF